jgi:hypothetical protein
MKEENLGVGEGGNMSSVCAGWVSVELFACEPGIRINVLTWR